MKTHTDIHEAHQSAQGEILFYIYIYTRALLFYLVGAAWMRSGGTSGKNAPGKILGSADSDETLFQVV